MTGSPPVTRLSASFTMSVSFACITLAQIGLEPAPCSTLHDERAGYDAIACLVLASVGSRRSPSRRVSDQVFSFWH
jgi:hypothetical protein